MCGASRCSHIASRDGIAVDADNLVDDWMYRCYGCAGHRDGGCDYRRCAISVKCRQIFQADQRNHDDVAEARGRQMNMNKVAEEDGAGGIGRKIDINNLW